MRILSSSAPYLYNHNMWEQQKKWRRKIMYGSWIHVLLLLLYLTTEQVYNCSSSSNIVHDLKGISWRMSIIKRFIAITMNWIEKLCRCSFFRFWFDNGYEYRYNNISRTPSVGRTTMVSFVYFWLSKLWSYNWENAIANIVTDRWCF